MTKSTKPLRIDFVSDTVCPWCAIGYSQLSRALENTGIEVDIHWHPFELNPNLQSGGENLKQYGSDKYGISLDQAQERLNNVISAGKSAGFNFKFTDETRIWNTFDLHQLSFWAKGFGLEHNLKVAAFSAHFTKNVDISDHQVLADLAEQVGLNRKIALDVLADQRFADDVRQQENLWISRGIQGVPALVFDGQHLITGAQGVENYANILRQLYDKAGTVE